MLQIGLASVLGSLVAGKSVATKLMNPASSAVNESFGQIFDSIQGFSDQLKQSESRNGAENNSSEKSSPLLNHKSRSESQHANRSDRRATKTTNDSNSATVRNDDRSVEDDAKAKALYSRIDESSLTPEQKSGVKDAVKEVADKLKQMAKEDPGKLKELLANIDKMSLSDFLGQIGVSQESIKKIGQIFDTNAVMSQDLLAAISPAAKPTDKPGVEEKIQSVKNEATGDKVGEIKPAPEGDKVSVNANENRADTGVKNENQSQKSNLKPEQTPEKHSENKSGEKESSLKDGAKIKAAKEQVKPEQAQVKTDPSQNSIKSGTIAEALQNQANSQNSGKNIAAQTSVSGAKAVSGSLSDVVNQTGTPEGKTASAEAKIKADHILSGGRNIEKNVLEQVVQKARLLVKGGGQSRMTLRLDPPHLGKIDMRIVVEDHNVKAIMMAENRDVKALIEQNIGALKNSLNASGLQVDEINVTTTGDQGGFMFSNENRAGENTNKNGNTNQLGAGAGDPLDAVEQIAKMAPAIRNQNGNLDLVA